MAFWRGERLEQQLKTLISDFDAKRVECASYNLRVGDQVFVTANDMQDRPPIGGLVSVLGPAPNHTVRIAPGQFAFLLTEEVVKVPATAMAFISMRARYKFKGLINVSGFHVDPGWDGKLLFSVYNAGPQEVVVARGEELFLIVYADLDQQTSMIYDGSSKYQSEIKIDLLRNMTTQVFSPQALKKQLDAVDEKMGRIELGTGIAAGVAAGLAAITAILIAAVALLPSWTGVVVARTLESAGFEVKMKAPDAEKK